MLARRGARTLMKGLFICRRGGEEILRAELQRTLPQIHHEIIGPGLVTAAITPEDSGLRPILAFSAQLLLNPQRLELASITAWARALTAALSEALNRDAGPWRLHIYPLSRGYEPTNERRAALIEQEVVKILKTRHRTILSRRLEDASSLTSAGLVQLALADASTGFLSVVTAEQARQFEHVLSPFAAGFVAVPIDKRPPSTAYRKVLEAQLRFGRRIGDGTSCVELGAAPGGWTHVLLEQGAVVTAIDRAPLRHDLMVHPRLTFRSGDAFDFVPAQPVEWLLSDVIAAPERSIQLIRSWVGQGWCRAFLVTVKFKGTGEYGLLEELKEWLRHYTRRFLLTQLVVNKNEVTVMGEL